MPGMSVALLVIGLSLYPVISIIHTFYRMGFYAGYAEYAKELQLEQMQAELREFGAGR